jgi:hypothetical protein
MNAPDLSQIVETFIPIAWNSSGSLQANLQGYYRLLAIDVGQLISDRRKGKEILWYSFLVHDRRSGDIPIPESDRRSFVHLRFELAPNVKEKEFIANLPSVCLYSRKVDPSKLIAMTGVRTEFLPGERIEEGWRVLGETSEWALSRLGVDLSDANELDKNTGQFLHYLENQLQLPQFVQSQLNP